MSAPYALVFFDVDSTLVTLEGIDELAGGDPEVRRLTEAAMSGQVAMEEVYGLRLARIRPGRAAVEALAERYLQSLVTGAAETVRTLRERHVDVHLLTAGIEQAVIPLAERLGLERRAVHAVPLFFEAGGAYAGFDQRSPLTRSGGKELVVLNVRARSHGKAALVGDGVTDLEARGAVDRFIGFGGVAVRDRVAREADVFVREPDLRAVLPHLLTEAS